MSKEELSRKFKALVHFMVHECENPMRLGAVRINKALWFTDRTAYQSTGESVTGEKYIKRQMGPVPASILSTLRELEEEGNIFVQKRGHPYDPHVFVSMKPPDVSLLTENDRLLAKSVLNIVCQHTATEVSELSHDASWEAASEGEEIPLCATLVTENGPITKEVREWAGAIVEKLEAVEGA